MNHLLNLRLNKLINKINNEKTLIEIVELLEKYGISIKGNITNTSKKTLLTESLKSARSSSIERLLTETREIISTKDDIKSIPVDLHDSFKASKVEKFLYAGELEEAIRVAFVRVNNRVKKMSGISADGASLMRTAFSKNDPKLKVNSLKTQEELDEQEGLMHIFEGSVLAFRNPHSHDDEKKISSQEAQRIISLANYLMLLLDRIELKVDSNV